MDTLPAGELPNGILDDSVLAHIANAYFSIAKTLERTTQCPTTRGFVLSALHAGTAPNQNQISLQLGIDRTVVHRAIKSMAEEGLVSEHKEKVGRAIQVRLTAKGKKYHQRLVEVRKSADEVVRAQLTSEEHNLLLNLLQRISECGFERSL